MNKKSSSSFLTRRDFLGKSACSTMALTGIIDTIAHLKLMQGALAQSGGSGGYKALVVLFLFGGNDSNNTLIPRIGHSQYDNYKDARGILGIVDDQHLGDPIPNTNATYDFASLPLTGTGLSEPHGIHYAMPEVQGLFDNQKLSFVRNVGTLSHPITRSDYFNSKHLLPPQLFSHSDQQIQWQSSISDQPFRTGWGGRAADELLSHQGSDVSLSISLAGINSLQVGNSTSQYAVTSSGAIPLTGYGTDYSSALNPDGTYKTGVHGRRLQAFDEITEYVHAHLLEDGYDEVVRTSRANEEVVNAAVAASDQTTIDNAFAAVSATSGLANQLKMIAKLISGRGTIGNSRQIFFCSAGGYDTHRNQMGYYNSQGNLVPGAHANLMEDLSKALAGFQGAMDGIGDTDNVLTITHSDFTRTLTPNGSSVSGDGSDHGWGGHHIVMGGPVDGGKVFGEFPELVVDGNYDAGTTRGRWLPTTSVDQYSAVAANWLGVPDLGTIFPNLSRFDDPFDPNASIPRNYIV